MIWHLWLPDFSHFINQPGTHWYCYNDAVHLLNEVKCQIRRSVANSKIFKIHLNFICLPASLSETPVALGVGLQKFHMIKVMVADL